MPRNIERDKREAGLTENQLIEAGFRLFSQNGIETVVRKKRQTLQMSALQRCTNIF